MGLMDDNSDDQTPLDEEEREGLKIRSIANRRELDEFEQNNIEQAITWLLHKEIGDNELFSAKFLSELHKRMFGQIWAWAGKYRRSGKSIGIEWTLIPIEMKKLSDDCAYWLENRTYSEEEIALRFSHRLVHIHPFSGGNGRISRLAADLIMERVFKRKPFSWGGSDLKPAGESRRCYIRALRKADSGDYQEFIDFANS